MTTKQQIIKFIYPALKRFGFKSDMANNTSGKPSCISFYDLSATTNKDQLISLKQYKGKKVLLVNTASDCGYTPQLAELQQLQEKYDKSLVVLGFPCNDFKEQEKGSDEDIATFCSVNFNVQFTLMKKSNVLKNRQPGQVFEWLTNEKQNGWNNNNPGWNFTKYLVNEQGILTHIFNTGISPLDIRLLQAIETI